MNNPMPKDNEVDETQHWGDLMRELRSKVPEGLAPLVDRLSFACDQRLSFLLHERYEQDLSHAATVAELRAEVERLVKALDEAACELSAAGQALAEFEGFEFRQKSAIDRAYAASRKAHDANGYTEVLTKESP
ncbi:MAG: hypothetical protein HZT39_09620 [Pseudoxanthomonas sp.]|nr:MAG: hypothetical protein HZT39_09620 [Pseudoxanthomonas sp.]